MDNQILQVLATLVENKENPLNEKAFTTILRLCRHHMDITKQHTPEGLNVLHEIVRHDRVDLLASLFYNGCLVELSEKPVTNKYSKYHNMTPVQLAKALHKTNMVRELEKWCEFDCGVCPINAVIRSGDCGKLKDIMRLDPEAVKMASDEVTSPLNWACVTGSLNILKMLADCGVSSEPARNPSTSRTELEDNILITAVKFGHRHLLEFLVNGLELNPNSISKSDMNPIDYAAENKDISTMDALIKLGARQSNSALLHAARSGGLDIIKYVIEKLNEDIDLNVKDINGRTPILIAAGSGYCDIIRLLVDCGADPCAVDNRKQTSLHLAINGGHTDTAIDIIKLLEEQGCTNKAINAKAFCKQFELVNIIRGKGKDGEPTWHCIEVQRALLSIYKHKLGGNLDVANYGKVIKSGQGVDPPDDVMRQIKADISQDNDRAEVLDLTPLHSAILRSLDDVINALLQYGADPNATDAYGMTSLHLACMMGNLRVVKELLANGAEVYAKDSTEKSAVQLAEMNEHYDVVKYLMSHTAVTSGAEPLQFVHIPRRLVGYRRGRSFVSPKFVVATVEDKEFILEPGKKQEPISFNGFAALSSMEP